MTRADKVPYPGLRSFERDEADVFFGRDECIDGMLDRLRETRFLAVLGSSGTGKSSLAKTGLLSALRMGLIAEAGSRWRVVIVKPGGAPLRNLARGLLEAERDQSGVERPTAAIETLRARLAARGSQAVIEWSRGHLEEHENLLLLIDQFEELFRYQDYAAQEEAEAFVELLLESVQASDRRVYVTITMRSEYLGPCALIAGLAEAISAGMFLIPRMTREQCREAIKGPAKLCGGDLDEALVNRLLNDLARLAPWEDSGEVDQLDRFARRADQLPLLQYTLNRMWLSAATSDSRPIRLTLEDYEKIGGLRGALDAQADDIFGGLDETHKVVAEAVFRALTEGTTIADAKRRPASFANLVGICGGEAYGGPLGTVIETFSKPGCGLLKIDPGPTIAADTTVEVTHESVIRQWKRLSQWVKKEAEAGQEWRLLKADADRYKNHRGDLLSGQQLATIDAWRKEEKPTEAWTMRYGDDYEAVTGFVDASLTENRRHKSRRHAAYAVAGLLVCALVGTAWFASHKHFESEGYRQLARHNDELAQHHAKLAESNKELADHNKELADHNARYRDAAKKHVKEVSPLLETLINQRRSLAGKMSDASRDPIGGVQSMVQRTTEFLDKDMLKLLGTRVDLIEGMMQIDNDQELMREDLVGVTQIGRWVNQEADDAFLRHTQRVKEVSTNLLQTKMDADDLMAVYLAYNNIIEKLDQSDTKRQDALNWVDDWLGKLRAIDASAVAKIDRWMAPADLLLYFTSNGLWQKGSILKHLDQSEEAEKPLQQGIENIEAWHRSTRRLCSALAGNLHNDLGAVLIAENKREKDVQKQQARSNRAVSEYMQALDCESNQLKTDDSTDNQRWMAIRATRLADVERDAGKNDGARSHYQLALEFRRKLVLADDAKAEKENYNNAQAKRDLATALINIGFFERRFGDKTIAVSHYSECRKMLQELMERKPEADNREALGLCESGLGSALRRLRLYQDGRSTLQDAEEAYGAAIAHLASAGGRDETYPLSLEMASSGLAATVTLSRGGGEEALAAWSKSNERALHILAAARRAHEKKARATMPNPSPTLWIQPAGTR